MNRKCLLNTNFTHKMKLKRVKIFKYILFIIIPPFPLHLFCVLAYVMGFPLVTSNTSKVIQVHMEKSKVFETKLILITVTCITRNS